jgi:hypothetical protein
MGCDIHLYVEKRDALGQWQSADNWELNPYYENDNSESGEPEYIIPYDNHFYNGRNYNLFAILANVRNGHGFAGVKTGEGFNPIAPPRGLPHDITKRVQSDATAYGEDGHSHSWLTLHELLTYDWTQSSEIYGWLHAVEFEQWDGYWRDRGESPQSYSADVFGGLVEKVDELTMRKKIAELRKSTPEQEFTNALAELHLYTQVTWKQYYYQVAKKFLGETIPRLLKLSEGDFESVRIVFWFDN